MPSFHIEFPRFVVTIISAFSLIPASHFSAEILEQFLLFSSSFSIQLWPLVGSVFSEIFPEFWSFWSWLIIISEFWFYSRQCRLHSSSFSIHRFPFRMWRAIDWANQISISFQANWIVIREGEKKCHISLALSNRRVSQQFDVRKGHGSINSCVSHFIISSQIGKLEKRFYTKL